jgi:DNA-directed RNA polymerase subunit RPC12/RpoP
MSLEKALNFKEFGVSMARVACAKCSSDIKLSPDQDEGSEIKCPSCGAELKVITDGEYLQTAEKAAA